jgi:hypothetical protein
MKDSDHSLFHGIDGYIETTWMKNDVKVTLLEKRYIVTSWIQYWYRLVTVADTNIGRLNSRYQ